VRDARSGIKRIARLENLPRTRDVFHQIINDIEADRVVVYILKKDAQKTGHVYSLDTENWTTRRRMAGGADASDDIDLDAMALTLVDADFGDSTLDALNNGQFGRGLCAVKSQLTPIYTQVIFASGCNTSGAASSAETRAETIRMLDLLASNLVELLKTELG